MTLTPELVEHAKKEINIGSFYAKSDVVTAQHLLHERFIKATKWCGLPKLLFYILLQEEYGMPHLKDAEGNLGFAIELNNQNLEP